MRQLGPYQLERELGRGGMGVVYAARHAELGRQVAVKLLLDRDPRARARFAREALSQAQLRHPNVVAVHERGEAPQGPYLVMDLIEGESLRGRLEREGRLPVADAVEVVLAAGRGLAAAHAAGILHRDLKPANVLLERATGRVLLSDFGLARGVESDDRLTETGAVLGTPQFMAPEQLGASGGKADARTDVFGLGGVLYTALCGQPPVEPGPVVTMIHRVLREPPPSLRAACPEVPADLEAVCLRCLEKRPAARYATVEALLADLERFQRGEPVEAQSPSRLRIALRRRGLLILPLLGVALLLGVTLTWTPGAQRAASGPRPSLLAAAKPTPAPTPESAQTSPPDWVAKAERWRRRIEAAKTNADFRALLPQLEAAWPGFGPEHPAYPTLGRAYAKVLYEVAVVRGFSFEQTDLVSRVIELDPEHVLARRMRALRNDWRIGVRERCERVVEDCDVALRIGEQLDPDEPAASRATLLVRKAEALATLGRREQALEAARQARETLGDQVVARFNRTLGSCYLELGLYAEAEAAFVQELRLKSYDHDARIGRGKALRGLGRLAEARQCFLRVAEARPRWPDPLVLRAELELLPGGQGRAVAREVLNQAIARSRSSWVARQASARLWLAEGKPLEALRDWKRSLVPTIHELKTHHVRLKQEIDAALKARR